MPYKLRLLHRPPKAEDDVEVVEDAEGEATSRLRDGLDRMCSTSESESIPCRSRADRLWPLDTLGDVCCMRRWTFLCTLSGLSELLVLSRENVTPPV